jgi:hypothetical protein
MVKLATLEEAERELDAYYELALSVCECPIAFIGLEEIGADLFYELVGLSLPDANYGGLGGVYMLPEVAEALSRKRDLTIMR